jgi:predicted ArsR family transcriptional regulator
METQRPGPSGETIDTPRHRALGSASRARILRLIQAETGLLVRDRAGGGVPGRPPRRYRVAAPQPAPPPYRTLAAALLDHLAITGGGPADGRGAGTATGEVEVHLRTCPFLGLVGQHPDAMCGLHAGIIQGALRAAGPPGSQASLEPFAAPTACVVRLQLPALPGCGRP